MSDGTTLQNQIAHVSDAGAQPLNGQSALYSKGEAYAGQAPQRDGAQKEPALPPLRALRNPDVFLNSNIQDRTSSSHNQTFSVPRALSNTLDLQRLGVGNAQALSLASPVGAVSDRTRRFRSSTRDIYAPREEANSRGIVDQMELINRKYLGLTTPNRRVQPTPPQPLVSLQRTTFVQPPPQLYDTHALTERVRNTPVSRSLALPNSPRNFGADANAQAYAHAHAQAQAAGAPPPQPITRVSMQLAGGSTLQAPYSQTVVPRTSGAGQFTVRAHQDRGGSNNDYNNKNGNNNTLKAPAQARATLTPSMQYAVNRSMSWQAPDQIQVQAQPQHFVRQVVGFGTSTNKSAFEAHLMHASNGPTLAGVKTNYGEYSKQQQFYEPALVAAAIAGQRDRPKVSLYSAKALKNLSNLKIY